MKQIITILSLLIIVLTTSAQTSNKDYFQGNWNVEITGTSGGDQKLEVKLIQKDGKLQGTVTSKDDGTVKIKKVEEDGDSIKIYFKHGWFTVYLLMKKGDANHCSGKLMNKYPGKCKRMKEHQNQEKK